MTAHRLGRAALLVLAGAAAGYTVHEVGAAGVPAGPLGYSGYVVDSKGAPRSGSANILVQLFGAEAGGTPVCGSTPAPVTLVAGHFRVPLGDACTAAVHANPDLWAEVLVDGAVLAARHKLGAVAYALEADHASTAETAVALAPGAISAGLMYFNVDISSGSVPAPCVQIGGGPVVECTCPQGTFVVSGGGSAQSGAGKVLRESRPSSATSWRMTCAAGATDVLCYNYSFICSRLAP